MKRTLCPVWHPQAAVLLFAALLAAPAPSAQQLRLENRDGGSFSNRLVMSRIGTLASPPAANGVHDVSTLRLHNDGSAPLTVSALTLTGPFAFASTTTLPATVATGASLDVPVRFIAQSGTLSGGTRGIHEGTLTISSNAVGAPSTVVTLGGYWQTGSEAGEPRLVELGERVFGYSTEILLPGQNINNRGRIELVGDEVLSAYWRLADTSKPVSVQQLAAYHGCCTDAAPLYWFTRGTTAATLVLRHAPADGQTVFPRRNGSSTALATATFAPGAATTFGFRVASNEWSDAFLNVKANDDCTGGNGTCGHHVRFWPAKNPNGTVIPDTYLMGMDYAGINYDFQDNIYLISNITPAEAVTTSGPVRINAGGPEVVTGGVTFGANQFSSNGQSYTPTCGLGDIAGTTDDDIYRTEIEPRTGGSGPRTFSYNIPVPNGSYNVRLHFAEIYFGSCGAPAATVGRRVFDVRMEGALVLDDLDIFATVGVRAALVRTFPTSVVGGVLNVDFLASANNPMLSAIEVLPATIDLPPSAPTAVSATGSLTGVALDWANNTEPDLAGYRVYRSALMGGPYVQLTASPISTSDYADATLSSGERAFYIVRAVDTAGNESAASAEVHAARFVPISTFAAVNWSAVAAQPLANSEGQSAVVGDRLYSFGGFDVEKKNGPCNCFTPTPRAYVYDPTAGAAGTWSALAPLPHLNNGGVTHAGVATNGVDIFFAGGYISNPARTGQIFGTKQVWRYNVASNTYTRLPDLPADRAAGQLAYYDGRLYYFGGTNKARTADVGNLYSLDYAAFTAGQSPAWTSRAALPNPRHHMGAVVLNHLIYAVGGQHGHDAALVTQKSVHAYDPASNVWTAVADLPAARSHISSTTFVHEGRIFVLGGEATHTTDANTVYAYDPSTSAWATLNPLPANRSSAVGGSLGGALYVSTGNFRATTLRGVPGVVNQPPTASFTATPDGANPLLVVFNAAGSSDPDGTIVRYSWTFGDGSPADTTGATPSHTYAAAGTYTVVLTVTDDDGATASVEQTISVTAAPQRPSVTGTSPAAGATGVLRDAFVAVDVSLPNVGDGIDGSTLNASTVRLYPTGNPGAAVPAQLNTSGGGDAVVLQPLALLGANVAYTFEVTEGLKDLAGQAFLPFTTSFTTGSLPTGAAPSDVQFERVSLSGGMPSAAGRHSSLAIGPDGRLYATTIQGAIKRWDLNPDGTLANPQTFNSLQAANGGSRLAIGLAFDPASTAAAPILWVSHSTFGFNGVPDWGGKLTRLSGPAFETVQDYVVGLPRSIRDHATNSIAFGPDGALYVLQGSNSAMGEPDAAWGNRTEHLLSAAVLRVDVVALQAGGALPLDAKTEEGGTYDPFAPGALVEIFASGVRNAYDLVWHTNGDLYVPTNGSAANGRTPASVANTIRPDGTPYFGPTIPALDSVETQNDYLFRVPPPSGGTWGYTYYGHPNPSRGEYVLNGGNPTAGADLAQVDRYPVGVAPDAAWGGFAYNFGRNISPNGAIEYRSNTFNGKLQGKLLVVRYSGGDDIIVLTPDLTRNIAPDGDAKLFIQAVAVLSDPLDLVENLANGFLYVSEYGGPGQILLLRPIGNQPPTASFTATPSPTDSLTYAFNGSGSTDPNGTIVRYSWTFGDGSPADTTGATPSHTYAAAGTYIVTLTVTDDSGASGSTQRTIEVGTPPGTPVASFTATPDGENPLAYTFDGSTSSDPNGTIVRYSWTFGDGSPADTTGATPSHTYAAAGTYTVVLTVTDDSGATDTAQQTLTVGLPPDGPFAEAGGLFVAEAENFHVNVPRGGVSWDPVPATGSVGTALGTLPNVGANINTGFATTSPELGYRVVFSTTGTYYVWGRVLAPSDDDDSFHTGIDGTMPALADRLFTMERAGLTWTNITMDKSGGAFRRATMQVPTTGEHVVNVWMREDGLVLDRILLTTNAALTPSGDGPPESSRTFNPLQAAIDGVAKDGEDARAAIPLPVEYSLEANRPNPFRARTTIRYGLPEDAPVRLEVYDALGRRVASLVEGTQTAGWHEASFDASSFATGVYVYRLEAGSFAKTMRMLVVR